jgi:calcineurin-like phosphoesterase family protein
MSGKTWIYSDPHFYHKNIVTFLNYNGTKVRPWDCAEQMTEDMIEMYNELVSDTDRVYILGDVAFKNSDMHKSVGRLKGRKVLVPGNHEPTKMRQYFNLFDDVRGYVVKKGFIMSHIPLHPSSMGRWQLNIHGHLHNNVVRNIVNVKGEYIETQTEDKRYYCACVERTNFRPKLLDEILHERGLK